jgi:hypothetical protein
MFPTLSHAMFPIPARDEEAPMDEQGSTQVSDEDIQTVFTGTGTMATVADPQDADGTDADDVQDADGTDGDATDGTDGDAGDADGRDA